MNPEARKCPECSSANLYKTTASSGGDLLPGLGRFMDCAQFKVVLCGDCGLTRLYADQSARDKLVKSKQWKRL